MRVTRYFNSGAAKNGVRLFPCSGGRHFTPRLEAGVDSIEHLGGHSDPAIMMANVKEISEATASRKRIELLCYHSVGKGNERAVAVADQPYRFTREQFYAIAESFDPQLRYELIDGTIYQMIPAKPPYAGSLRSSKIG